MSDIANQPRPASPVTSRVAALLTRRPGTLVYGAVAVAALAGWLYLAAMLAAMPSSMDMAELGPACGFSTNSAPLRICRRRCARVSRPCACLGTPAASEWRARARGG
ncbi:hypothetical protein [Breoghania sp. L-A4]|uniref:hypothetical protein n=1 Tax=Breoghania sp. L-A4 TaxID=2304600 RepID=UPI0013C2B86F|nr:hypothetical protein [Breoghania sp. L-A4]